MTCSSIFLPAILAFFMPGPFGLRGGCGKLAKSADRGALVTLHLFHMQLHENAYEKEMLNTVHMFSDGQFSEPVV